MIEKVLEFCFRIVEPLLPKSMRNGYIRVLFLGLDDTLRGSYVKGKQNYFTIGRKRYEINQGQIYRQGRFRTPTLFYLDNQAVPISLRPNMDDKTWKLSAEENHERMESHIAREIVTSFDDNALSGKMPAIILLIAIAAIGAMGYYQMEELKELIQLALPGASTTSTLGR
ncbi:MAG: hypothetical protein FVQ79_07450 [Planctomycetes bacterium]|nr:hypothetical protein [Planctomycetota bacterium]